MLRLVLSELSVDALRGPNDAAYKGKVPARARFLAPDAAFAVLKLTGDTGGKLVATDVFRSAESSLAARRTKRGVQAPGYSGHNFGLSIDWDVAECLRVLKLNYAGFVDLMAQYGFHCHRRDLDATGSESWHFNYLGPGAVGYLVYADPQSPKTWAAPIEARIKERYGPQFALDAKEAQGALQRLGLYRGAVDGLIGPLSREAIGAFQRAWLIPDTQLLDERTQRTLAYVAAERWLEPPREHVATV